MKLYVFQQILLMSILLFLISLWSFLGDKKHGVKTKVNSRYTGMAILIIKLIGMGKFSFKRTGQCSEWKSKLNKKIILM